MLNCVFGSFGGAKEASEWVRKCRDILKQDGMKLIDIRYQYIYGSTTVWAIQVIWDEPEPIEDSKEF